MELIKLGSTAPNFSLEDNHDKIINLSNYRGKKVLLSWHPLAWTPVCTDQMRSLENNWDNLQSLNTIAFGLSVDAQPCKKAWATAIVLNNLSILSDFWPHGKVTQDYGLFIQNDGISERANIIIDENGIVKWVKVYPMSQLPDINEVFQALSNI
ncbi:thioredoxin peroxidase [Clostridium carboxidivorans P7]|uniref:Alkyl hydroperoxide reductase/ Thiol specific antioxidant/ Mal allergen n=1 Tax=Clostridium carboxidivorans P7 TaxID=536227 RepID=C6PN06_9CLOT|nr:redoxin domain-containing protein [Clostridium carboxidivorans]AKN30887.1 thioredoxin peroxidase [Clostridium carboxidivorans P7]EET89339.1 alkyl hydroperoxide reductase/ Thiol specific antioxidant/ Mal allergen [Clostridium carboxidivorans P7]EFG88865.1 antioxidant, AhpC/TSA family [Clostridium carboxidivorans P7]